MTARILLVEDEDSIADPLAFLLEREGYRVRIARDGRAALEEFAKDTFDLVLLDLMLPFVPGTEVCREIRQTSQVPIIMLTAKDTEIDIVVGLELGADDYITKPYSSRELLARVRAMLRRSDTPRPESVEAEPLDDSVIEGHGIALDTERHEVHVRGERTQMPLREFELLSLLMRNQGRVLTRGQLIDRVWGSDYFGDTKTLDVHIKRIRARIEENPKQPQIVHTVRGVGYRFG
ncbi:response regulator transcription factor [Leucobacter sp. UCMA 4100]|uniref:response regulator transcription factor n=1 Tax=Leucobacter sp. UCMA 4100 TaxID=2810534 RepID=UPI0022EB486A|nr:response regulator transcription factor [Leucobacter sp. UCMA 4100]MDA3146550.1 response regulator transcription factor [Leucobacter sp. UCMA 4100]